MLDNVGGIAYLNQCEDMVTSTANIAEWIETVLNKFTLRKIIQVCTSAIGDAYMHTNGAGEILDRVEAAILQIRPNQKQSNDIKSLVREAIGKIEQKMNNPESLGGISTGLLDLDALSDGMHKGEMIVVCGFPSTGKTALSVNIAVNCATNKIPAAIFSAEMRPVQLVIRSLCANSRSNYHKLTEYDVVKMMPEAPKLANAPLFIEAAHGMTIGQINAVARRLKQKNSIQLIVVDYIQLIGGTGDNREQQISSISKGLKAMALELDLPVLALSQLTDDGKLRESRAIGQDADTVWKLVNDGEWMPKVQPINLMIEKCRDGETGKVKLTFLKEITRFENGTAAQI